MRRRIGFWAANLALLATIQGCARYAPAPLDSSAAVLAPVNPALLSADAARINRPYLAPQPIDLAKPLTPNELAVIAVIANPPLKALRAKVGVTDAQAFAARLLPDPTFGASFDKVLSGPDPFTGLGSQIGFDLNQLRTARVTRASGEASKRQVRLDVAWAEWQTSGQARLLGIRVLALEAQREIAGDSAASAQAMFAATQRAAGRGDLAASELDTRRQALLDATDRLRLVERDLVAARGDLDSQLGLPPETELRLATPPEPVTPPSSATLLAQALDRRLDLQALRAGYTAAEADLHKAVLDQFPNLTLSVGGARDTANNVTVGPAVAFTLPLWNRNRGGIAVATATRAQLKAEYDARLFQTRAEIDAAVSALKTARRQRDELQSQLPALAGYAAATERAAKRGDLSLATAAAASQAVRDRQLTLAQLNQQIAEQTIALELLSGGPAEGWTQ